MSLPNTALYYRDGSSDKVYHARINEVDGGYTVTFAYGRRGNALTAGTKTTTPVSLDKATTIYDKLVQEKMSKGYTPSGDGKVFTATDNESRVTGLIPQLLNPITESEANKYLTDPEWLIQEKFDGKRIMVSVTDGVVVGSNRKGLSVSLPQEIADVLARLPNCILDGELLADHYVAFDILNIDGDDMRDRAYSDRYPYFSGMLLDHSCFPFVISAPFADGGYTNKTIFFQKVKRSGGEGVVFKRLDSKYVPGRPASGGSQLKCKFVATATCQVTRINDKRSVQIAVLDITLIPVGNVTIPPNHAIPMVGDLVEVQYLYAHRGGSLVQPIYLGVRDDVLADSYESLQFKNEGESDEEI